MKIIIDERERDLFDRCEALIRSQTKATYIQLSKEVLTLGDILIKTDDDKDVLLIERKSFSDLLASIKDGRYEEQSYRLLNSSGFPPHSIIYLLEGMFSNVRTALDKNIIYSSITSLQYFKGFSTHRTATLHETAEWILLLADKIERNFSKGIVPYYLTEPFFKIFKKKDEKEENELTEKMEENVFRSSSEYCHVVKKVKKENVRPDNIGEIILCQIPGISSVTAIAIMKEFTNFPDFMKKLEENPCCIDNITTENNGKVRKISKKSVESIKKYLLDITE